MMLRVLLGFGLRSGLTFALFQTFFATLTATIEFFSAFYFFVSHDDLLCQKCYAMDGTRSPQYVRRAYDLNIVMHRPNHAIKAGVRSFRPFERSVALLPVRFAAVRKL